MLKQGQIMSNFDFIPQNNTRTEPDMNVVGLFLKAIMKKGYYETYPQDGIKHRLTDAGVLALAVCFPEKQRNSTSSASCPATSAMHGRF